MRPGQGDRSGLDKGAGCCFLGQPQCQGASSPGHSPATPAVTAALGSSRSTATGLKRGLCPLKPRQHSHTGGKRAFIYSNKRRRVELLRADPAPPEGFPRYSSASPTYTGRRMARLPRARRGPRAPAQVVGRRCPVPAPVPGKCPTTPLHPYPGSSQGLAHRGQAG